MRRLLLGAALAAVLASAAPALEPGFAPVAVSTTPIETFLPGGGETGFGDLEFLGGLELAFDDRSVGGFSGIDFLADGATLIAVSDTGHWFTARLAEDGGGRPVGLADAGVAAMLMDDGRPPPTKIDGDAEGVRIVLRDGVPVALVSFEQDPAVRAYAGPDFASARPERLPLPGFVYGLPVNQGLESVAVAPPDGPLAGALVVIAEKALDETGDHRGFVLDGPRAGAFAIRRSDDFDISDAAFLPGGDLLLLERRFGYLAGFAMRLRRISADEIRPGATIDGDILMEADSRHRIDNMEGLAVTVRDDRTILTLISDDNTSLFQRTLLLRFALADE